MRAASLSPAPTRATVAETPDVSVIIVNYNVREFLEQALESVAEASAGLCVETFVVDNDSADGSVAMVQERFPEVHVIANETNVGFARANNQAIREARGRHLLILNPDTLLQENTLQKLVRFMDTHPEAGAAGCRILNPDGTFAPESRRAFPTPSVAFYRLTGLSRLFHHSPTFGRYNLTYLPKDEVCEVDALSGSCMMVRRAALYASREEAEHMSVGGNGAHGVPLPPTPHANGGAGLFDEHFFMYGEDLDWCYRIQQAGWRIYYTPETQIIHYKGESTKKGELRYVRLFYGAMLRFVEKHLSGNTEAGFLRRLASRGLALALRVGIVVRALLSFLGQGATVLRAPAADFVLALLAMLLSTALWASQTSASFRPSFYTLVLPAYTLAGILGIALAGGYRRPRLRPMVAGLAGALLGVAALSFFVKTIAFSRGVLLLGFTMAGVLLLARRLVRRTRVQGSRRVLLVGSAHEASRLQRLVGGRMRPMVHLLGFVSDAPSRERASAKAPAPPHLGTPRHLRDLVRLQEADEVVFAADSLSNTAILGFMRQLRDLPIQLKILASNRDRIIGKASIEDFSVPFVEAERAVAPLRSAVARRLLDVPVSLVGSALHPLLRFSARVTGSQHLRRLTCTSALMRGVLTGQRALVGFDPSGPHPPSDWGLAPGVVSILDTIPERPVSIVEAQRAYWFYARNQSLMLDVEILLRALTRSEGRTATDDG
ncbi:MAG: glycosyltransferase [Rhodothermaceae bacterium]|nr:glycosyltransferase [Rhodothermaceae bacterium]